MGNVLAFTYPGGRPRTIAIAATAGNVITNLSPTAGFKWVILRGELTIVTDVTVANRFIIIALTDGTNIVENFGASNAAVTASLTRGTDLGEIQNQTNVTGVGRGGNTYFGFDRIELDGIEQLRITIQNGVAGDSYSGFFKVLEVRL